MSYRYMRMILMFDMPVDTVEERKAYRKFRKFLIDEGFIMHQFSIYSKLLLNNSANNAMIERLKIHNPKKGNITLLTVTEKQFSRMIYLNGERNTSVANSDARLVFLGEEPRDEALAIENATFLVLEDQFTFSTIVKQFYQYTDDGELKLFDRNLKALKESELLVITDVLGYNLNSPAMLKLIHADLENQLNDKPEVKSMIEKLVATITELLAFECLENELDLEYDEITILELIDALGVKVETLSDTPFEKMLEIVQVFKYLSKKKLLIFINASAYLSKDELVNLIEYIQLNQLRVLFVEPRKVYDFPQYVLDQDYFLNPENMV